MTKIILILGMPCSGKTTLGKKLSNILNCPHLSVGDLIRENLGKEKAISQQVQAAFNGQTTFSEEYLKGLLEETNYFNTSEEMIVLDAGPPIEKSLSSLKDSNVICCLNIKTSFKKRFERFNSRKNTNHRKDDTLLFFKNRTQMYEANLLNTITYFSKCDLVFDLNGNVNEQKVLMQAIDCININLSLKNSIQLYLTDAEMSLDNVKDRMIEEALTKKRPYKYYIENEGDFINNLILLIKPGLNYPRNIIEKINFYIEKQHYYIRAMSVFPGLNIREYSVARSHFGHQYTSSIITTSSNEISSLKLFKEVGYEKYERIWDKIQNTNKKNSHYLWHSDYQNKSILNGHMPTILDTYENEENYVIALHIATLNQKGKSIEYMKKSFLGASNPKNAPKKSLRKMAYQGEFDIEGLVSLQNNAFHLSTSSLEAYRETCVWFGKDYADLTFNSFFNKNKVDSSKVLYDSFPNGSSLYERTSMLDENNFSKGGEIE